MKQELVTKYILGELVLRDILGYGVRAIKIKTHELPAVRVRKNKKNLLINMDSLETREADFTVPLDSKVKKINNEYVEIDFKETDSNVILIFEKSIEM